MHAPVGAQLASIWEKPSILQMKFKWLIAKLRIPYTLFETENEWQKTKVVLIPLPRCQNRKQVFPNGGQLGSHGGMHMMTAAGNYASMPPGSPEQSNSTSPGIGGGGGGPSGNPGNLSMGFDNKIVRG